MKNTELNLKTNVNQCNDQLQCFAICCNVIRTTEATGTNVLTETTAISGTIAANSKTLMKANSSIIEVHVGVLVGAIVATIFIITLIYLIIWFSKRKNRENKFTQTNFPPEEKWPHEKPRRISRFPQPIYDIPYEDEIYEIPYEEIRI